MVTTTFLFVDQVGSTEQLSRLGDAAAQRVRRALFDLLRQSTQVHGGHEVDFTGDGLFCSFESAADAVDAAVEMQQGVTAFGRRQPADESLAIKIGLNTGEPLESEGGGHFGGAVVVASRLCSRAEAGQILASALVRALVAPRGRHAFASVGRLDLKGIPEPVETYAVEWTPEDRRAYLPPPLAAVRTGPFVDRSREIDAVLAAWKRIGDGGRQLLLISGDSGMGVTRLAAEAAELLRARGASVWAGSAQGPDERLAAWAEAVECWAGSVSRAELRQAVGDSASDLVRLLPGLARLLPTAGGSGSTDAQAVTFLIADAVDAVADRWSGVEPLVIVLDRLHHADAATLTVLRRLLHSRRGGRVMVIGCYEPSSLGTSRVLSALGDVPHLVDVRLAGLEEPDVRQLIGAITSEPVSDEGVRAVMAETEGSPYYVVQMARSMHQQGITRRVEEAVGRAVELRSDLRLQREEVALGLRQLDELREEITTAVPARIDPDGTPPAPGVCPYRGLLAFTTEDADTFFGRDALIAEMVAGLSVSRWLAVVGSSGSGKSSAVRAGLHPALTRGALPGSAGWVVVDVRPGARPLDALGEALAQPAGADGGELAEELGSAPLSAICGRLFGTRRLVLHVDQFEELWTAAPLDVRRRTLDLLVEAATAADEAVSVVVTMRADYYGRTAEHPALASRMAESQVLVPPMTAAELRAAVEMPARQAGLVLEPGLAQVVVDDVAREPGPLPLLSTAMQETWERRRGRSLTLTGYAETGGARRAIAHLADATLDGLDPRQQEVARRLLLRLAAPARDGGDVARPAPLSELIVDEETQLVLDRLADRRLITVGATTAQVAHEALLREWPRLRGWLDADRDGRRLQQQIATAAEEWQSAGRDDDALLRGARLAAADEWRDEHVDDLSAREREFLDASVGLRERDLRRARRTTRRFQVLAVVLVALLAGTAVATYMAVDNSRTASERANEAIARDLVNQSGTLATSRLDTALLLAVEAYRRNPAPETEGGLLTALNGARHLAGFRHELPSVVVASAMSSSGGLLYVLTPSGEVQVFDTADWSTEPVILASGVVDPGSLDVSPDGEWLVVGGGNGGQLLNVAEGATGTPLPGRERTFAEFTSDGRFIVAGRAEGFVLLDSRTGAVAHELPLDIGLMVAVRPGRDEALVANDSDFRLRRLRLDGSQIGRAVEMGDMVLGMTYTADGNYVLASMSDGSVTLLDGDSLQAIGEPLASPGNGFPTWMEPAPAGDSLAVGYDDGSVSVVSIESEFGLAEMFRTPRLAGGVATPHWLSENRLLAVTASTAAEFDLRDSTPLAERMGLERRDDIIEGFAAAPDGKSVVYVMDGHLRMAGIAGEPTSLDAPLPIATGQGGVALAVAPDGSAAAIAGLGEAVSGSEEQSAAGETVVALVSLLEGAEVRSWKFTSESDVPDLVFAPDGETLAVLTDPRKIVEIDVGSATPLGEPLDMPEHVNAVTYSPDGRRLLIGDITGSVRSVDRATGDVGVARTVGPGASVMSMAVTPQGERLLVATSTGRILSADPATEAGELEPLLQLGSRVLSGLVVSPDGSQLAVTDQEGLLHLWDLVTGRTLGPPLASDSGGNDVAYVRGGSQVITSTFEDLLSWNLDPQSWSATACRLVGREMTPQEWNTYLPDEPYRATCSAD